MRGRRPLKTSFTGAPDDPPAGQLARRPGGHRNFKGETNHPDFQMAALEVTGEKYEALTFPAQIGRFTPNSSR
jgi:hypothetical protein